MNWPIFIRCVQRPDTNVHFTIANMACADPVGFASIGQIHVVSGDGQIEHVATLGQMNSVTIHHKPVDSISEWAPKRKGAWSYEFALCEAVKVNQDFLVLEDDITFANGWAQTMREIVALLPRPFVLSAYHHCAVTSPYSWLKMPNYKADDHGTQFWGNLCTFWCKELVPEFLAYFRPIVASQAHVGTDLSVQQFCETKGVPLFVTVPSLVQHMGDKTMLRDDGIRRGPMYDDSFYGADLMPYSSPVTDPSVRFCLAKLPKDIRKALDVGVGAGKYGAILRSVFPGIKVHGIEGCDKYLTEFKKQHEVYASIVHTDVRAWLKKHHDWSTDLVVFGDVLEHLGYSEALDAVHRASYHCRFMLLVWPERRPQGAYQGNELEVHSCVLLPTDFTRFTLVDCATVRADSFDKHVLLVKGLL